ncbi:WhiB family transcription factor [Microbacterium phage Xitlalli]|nr:WhiB family transcription factor [Microbacterium phage Xitlalli]
MVGRLISDVVTFESPRREEWMDQSACANTDPNLFFNKDKAHEAKAICNDCPVRIQCLAKALVDEKTVSRRTGIFGGMNAAERKQLQEHLNNMQKAQVSATSDQEEENNG